MTHHIRSFWIAFGTIIGVAVAIALLVRVLGLILLPFVLAGLLAYILSPLIDRLEGWARSRLAAVIILFGVFFGVLGVGAFFLPLVFSELYGLSQSIPTYLSNLHQFSDSGIRILREKAPILDQMGYISKIQHYISELAGRNVQILPTRILYLASILSYLILTPFVLFFFLLQGHSIKKNIFGLIPNRQFELFVSIYTNISNKLGLYLRGLLIESSIVAGLSVAFLMVMDIRYAILIGVVAGFANMVPYLGPVCGAVPALAIYYIQYHSLSGMVAILVGFICIQLIDNLLVQPVVFSKSIDLHPLWVILAVLIGGNYGGFLGLLLAVPVAGVIQVVIVQLRREFQFRRYVSIMGQVK